MFFLGRLYDVYLWRRRDKSTIIAIVGAPLMHLDTLRSVDHRRINIAGNIGLKETGFLALGGARWLLLLRYRLQFLTLKSRCSLV